MNERLWRGDHFSHVGDARLEVYTVVRKRPLARPPVGKLLAMGRYTEQPAGFLFGGRAEHRQRAVVDRVTGRQIAKARRSRELDRYAPHRYLCSPCAAGDCRKHEDRADPQDVHGCPSSSGRHDLTQRLKRSKRVHASMPGGKDRSWPFAGIDRCPLIGRYWAHSGRGAETAETTRLTLSGPAWSIWFRARELDHLGPLFGFLADELAEVGGRARKHRAAEVGKPRFNLGISEARIDLIIELLDNLDGRVPGCANAKPLARLIAGHEVTHGRNFG